MKIINYIRDIAVGMFRLMQGMYVSMLQMIRPKITEQYPENRGKKEQFERFRGELTMPHDDDNRHRCTACKICETGCPNGSIQITVKQERDEATGKEKKVLDVYRYDIGSCIFCALCTRTCPQDAIEWTPLFEHAVFTQQKLQKQLNREGSVVKLRTKSEE